MQPHSRTVLNDVF